MLLSLTTPRYTTSKTKVIAGRTFEIGAPKSKIVRVYSRENGALLKQVKSDADGIYKVYVPYDMAYLIIGVDGNKKFNAVIQDNVVPK